jgi:pilus assembly protein CpaF
MANLDLPSQAIREQVASALHLLVQLARFNDGVRRVTHVTEIIGMEGQIVTMQDLFTFNQTGVDSEGRIIGRLTATGLRPTFAERFNQSGIQLPESVFLVGRGV